MSKDKPKASDRTVGLFDGKTDKEKADEAERIQQGLDNVDNSKVGSPKIEDNVDRWRASAFEGREAVSKHFGDESAGENQYRLSWRGPVAYLEKTGNNDAGAYSYAGMFFPEGDMEAVARVFVEAFRAKAKGKKK